MQDSSQPESGDSIGDWPQRLLHVQTMTSYEWQKGHRYGTHTKPFYSAISYTWGRYQLTASSDQPHVKPIGIRGVNWNIPRIDEAHFTVTQLEELLRRSIDHRPNPTKGHYNISIDFVWLDVACINQTPNHPQMAFEIGRQARIFRNAKRVFVWLTQSTHANLEKSIRQLRVAEEAAGRIHLGKAEDLPVSQNWTSIPENQSMAFYAGNRQRLFLMGRSIRAKIKDRWFSSPTRRSSAAIADTETWLPIALASIKSITQDRWFSSVWTLQEAFLSQWAYLISGEIENLQPQAPQLRDIFETCESSSKICRASVAEKNTLGRPILPAESELLDVVEKSGLGALAVDSPMALYTVASNRTCSRPVDRIYGIMQVFGFQLGISAPDADIANPPQLPELELQLGQHLATKFPIMSQMHVHNSPSANGQSWRVSSNSTVPDLVTNVPFNVMSSMMGDHTSLCRLSHREINSVMWGWFSGKICPADQLQKAWKLVDSRGAAAKIIGGKSTQQMMLDSTLLLPRSAFTDSPQEDIPRDKRQHRRATELVEYFGQKHLAGFVLLLGRFSDEQHCDDWWEMSGGRRPGITGDRFNIGLILVKQHVSEGDVWRRLGICIWDLSHLAGRPDGRGAAPERELLEGLSADWEQTHGIFG